MYTKNQFLKDKYKIISKIGTGSFGEVFKVISLNNNQLYACKVISKFFHDSYTTKNILKEIITLRYLSNYLNFP